MLKTDSQRNLLRIKSHLLEKLLAVMKNLMANRSSGCQVVSYPLFCKKQGLHASPVFWEMYAKCDRPITTSPCLNGTEKKSNTD